MGEGCHLEMYWQRSILFEAAARDPFLDGACARTLVRGPRLDSTGIDDILAICLEAGRRRADDP
jgi:hypothetical protein